MAISGAWKNQASVSYVGAQRWGTGINPVHSVLTDDVLERGELNAMGDGPYVAPIPEAVTSESQDHVDYGYQDEDSSSALWGYGFATGTESRPGWGTDDDRGDSGEFPPHAPPPGPKGTLTGNRIRGLRRGAQATITSKTAIAMPNAQPGLLNKANNGVVEDAVVSDPSQYEMQTSMTQRDKTREGSQRGAGSASEYSAPVQSQRPTWKQRALPVSGGERHYDMMPRQQDTILRGFRFRTAGTGPRRNSPMPEGMFQTQPRQRVPADNPDQGPEVVDTSYGFVGEDDQGWYLS